MKLFIIALPGVFSCVTCPVGAWEKDILPKKGAGLADRSYAAPGVLGLVWCNHSKLPRVKTF